MANQSIYNAFERMWQHIVAALGKKADASHSHNDVYYTKTQVDSSVSSLNSAINGKSDTGHGHTISSITNLQTALDGKADNGDVPTKLSQLDNDTGFITSADIDTTTNHVHSNKTALDSITSTKVANWDAAATNVVTAQAKADSAYTLAEGKVDSLSDLGITATAKELNYVDGVTSNIQTQLDGKAASSHGTHVSYGTSSTAVGATAGAGSASTVSRSDHTHSLSKNAVTTALGYTPPTTDTKYTHPSYTAKSSGLYKVTVDSTGHVSAATAVAKSDITSLGIPSQDTTYSTFVKSGSGAAAGLVPKPSTTAGTTKYLREDGTWQVPPSGSTITVDSSLSSSSTNPVQNKVVNTALGGKAPTSHASSATTYGIGSSSNYGHVKLSDSTSSTSAASSGVAASPKAVKAAYDLAAAAMPKGGGEFEGYVTFAPDAGLGLLNGSGMAFLSTATLPEQAKGSNLILVTPDDNGLHIGHWVDGVWQYNFLRFGFDGTIDGKLVDNIMPKSGGSFTGVVRAPSPLRITAENSPAVEFFKDNSVCTGVTYYDQTNRRFTFSEFNADTDGLSTRYATRFYLPNATAGLTGHEYVPIMTAKGGSFTGKAKALGTKRTIDYNGGELMNITVRNNANSAAVGTQFLVFTRK